MAHSKCIPCNARVWRDGPASDHVDDLCPGCGGPLEAVDDLSELVGLRALRSRPRSARRLPDLSAQISEQIRETMRSTTMSTREPSAEEEIRRTVNRLSRPHRSGGVVIERAAILATGRDSTAIFEWITAHAGEPEAAAPAAPPRGLHGTGFGGGTTAPRGPARYVLPAGALTSTP